jgi:hypothetical protein
MSAKIKVEVRQVNIYGVGRETVFTSHDFWGLKLRPCLVFIACVFKVDLSLFWKKNLGWHDTLEELTLRIDAHTDDRKNL